LLELRLALRLRLEALRAPVVPAVLREGAPGGHAQGKRCDGDGHGLGTGLDHLKLLCVDDRFSVGPVGVARAAFR
jgi:hypothetical protein